MAFELSYMYVTAEMDSDCTKLLCIVPERFPRTEYQSWPWPQTQTSSHCQQLIYEVLKLLNIKYTL